jgi:hypothetical protein
MPCRTCHRVLQLLQAATVEVMMPSPFPGMDPYLEGSLWTTLHHSLATEIVRQLAPKLRPLYVALPVERFVMDMASGVTVTTVSVYPDVGVAEAQQQARKPAETAAILAPLQLATVMPEAVPHVTVEIRDTHQRQLVTAIEILSPTNKRGEGRREYLIKRQRFLLSAVHLMEIDLLRIGERVPMQHSLPNTPYFVFLSRAEDRPITDVWPIALHAPLPTVPVPLLSSDSDVLLDLQAAFTAAYDLPGYDLIVDYSQPPDVPFSETEAAWAAAHL